MWNIAEVTHWTLADLKMNERTQGQVSNLSLFMNSNPRPARFEERTEEHHRRCYAARYKMLSLGIRVIGEVACFGGYKITTGPSNAASDEDYRHPHRTLSVIFTGASWTIKDVISVVLFASDLKTFKDFEFATYFITKYRMENRCAPFLALCEYGWLEPQPRAYFDEVPEENKSDSHPMPVENLFPLDEFLCVCPRTVGPKASKTMLIYQCAEIELVRCRPYNEIPCLLKDHEATLDKRVMMPIALEVDNLDTNKCFCSVYMVAIEDEFFIRRAT